MLRRSTLIVSGIIIIILYPFNEEISAREIPVFPLVGSTIVPPGFSLPDFSAASIIPRAALSFTLLPKLKPSSLT